MPSATALKPPSTRWARTHVARRRAPCGLAAGPRTAATPRPARRRTRPASRGARTARASSPRSASGGHVGQRQSVERGGLAGAGRAGPDRRCPSAIDIDDRLEVVRTVDRRRARPRGPARGSAARRHGCIHRGWSSTASPAPSCRRRTGRAARACAGGWCRPTRHRSRSTGHRRTVRARCAPDRPADAHPRQIDIDARRRAAAAAARRPARPAPTTTTRMTTGQPPPSVAAICDDESPDFVSTVAPRTRATPSSSRTARPHRHPRTA